MIVPGLNEWLFSAKTFAAAMIAFYIALAVGLDRPYWCIATVYIVSQPLAGALRSKGLYRIIGTLVGAVAAVVLVPNLVDAPELLTAALALWLGACLYFALCDRTPASYAFLLAGYTASIIGFPAVDQPAGIFDVAIARVEEIGLGILSATLIGSIVLPRSVSPVLGERMAAYFVTLRRWALAALSGEQDEAKAQTARRDMTGASAEFDVLIAQLAHDTSQQHAATRPIAALRSRLVYLLPLVQDLADRIAAVRCQGGLTPGLRSLVDRVADFLRAGPETSPEIGRQLRADLAGAAPDLDTPDMDTPDLDTRGMDTRGWTAILRAALVARLAEFVDAVADIHALRRQVLSADPRLPPLALPSDRVPDTTRYSDRTMALLSALAAALTIVLVCTFWIATGWPQGSIAVLMAAIASSFFASLDDPVPQMLAFVSDIMIGFVPAVIYLFVVMPQPPDFAALVLALAPFYVLLGTSTRGMTMALNLTMMMTLADSYSADFASFINTSTASAAGIMAAAAVTALVRSVGAAFIARRLRRACRRDVARAAARQGTIERPMLAALLLDRIGDLALRLADEDADTHMQRALRDVTVGLNIIDLRRDEAALPAAARDTVEATLVTVAAHYATPEPELPAPALLATIDRTIAAVAAVGTVPVQLLTELLAIRSGIFPDAPVPDATQAEAA